MSNPDTCSSRNSDAYGIIRSDFTICSNFEGSLDKSCVKGFDNESENCGYRYAMTNLAASRNPNETIVFTNIWQ